MVLSSKTVRGLVAAFLVLLFSLGVVRLAGMQIPSDAASLPLLALFSLMRMTLAYLLSLAFALACGYYAAKDPRLGNLLIIVLDVLQSIPILGFFPAAVLLIVAAFGGSWVGIEAAAIFLIFTSMVWNMAFGIYESLTRIPSDLKAVSKSFGLRRFYYLEKFVIPASIPNLVYNSTLSWANGWYFLIASEIISLGSVQHKLPGLGSYLVETTAAGNLAGTFAGLLVLIAMILALDLLLWRPLAVWSERFRYDAPSGARPRSSVYRYFRWSPVMQNAKRTLTRAYEAAFAWAESKMDAYDSLQKKPGRAALFKGLGIAVMALVALVVLQLAMGILGLGWELLTQPLPALAGQIPMALAYSLGRLTLAFLISLLWTVPAAIWVSESPTAQRYFIPIFEVAAAVPATALFPIIVLIVIQLTGDLNWGSVLLLLTGMQWYLLFNAIIGARSLPNELETLAKSFKVKGWPYYKNFLFPAMAPSLVTGTMVAFGGGWNALFVAEYIVYGQQTYSTPGMGSLLAIATYQEGNFKLMLLVLAVMVLSIFAIHRFIFRRLFNYAVRKYRLEY